MFFSCFKGITLQFYAFLNNTERYLHVIVTFYLAHLDLTVVQNGSSSRAVAVSTSPLLSFLAQRDLGTLRRCNTL